MDTQRGDQPIYLDHAATTPCDPRVVAAMLPYFTEYFGNPSSRKHRYGSEARVAVENARKQAANLTGASPEEVHWTSGATEANNLVLLGCVDALRRTRRDEIHIITSTIEHSSIQEPCSNLEADGVHVTYLCPTSDGVVDPGDLTAAIRNDTALVSLCWANNETGVVNDIDAMGHICRERGILFHSDGTQIIGKLPVSEQAAMVDLLTWSAHKIFGPKGVGGLIVRRRKPRISLDPRTFGGGQEQGLRPGTLNVPGIVGFGAACQLRLDEMLAESARVGRLRDLLESQILKQLPNAQVNGIGAERVPHITNIGFSSLPELVIDHLTGIACSSGSACSSGDGRPSRVLVEMGVNEDIASNSLRLSLGRETTDATIGKAAEEIVRVVRRLMGGSH